MLNDLLPGRAYAGIARLLLLLLCGPQLGCSLVLDWTHDGLACSPSAADPKSYECLQGYSCVAQDNQCVADYALRLHDNCFEPVQCAQGLVCPYGGPIADANSLAKGYRCVSPCSGGDPNTPSTHIYEADACGPGEICYNFSGRAASTDAAHMDSACDNGDGCNEHADCQTPRSGAGGICVGISDTAKACLPSCTLSWGTGGATYSDNCGQATSHCEPLGLQNARHLVCLDAGGIPPLADGQTCANPAANPCKPGSGCINRVCRKYCASVGASTPTQSNCATNENCCAIHFGPNEPVSNTGSGYCYPSQDANKQPQACVAF